MQNFKENEISQKDAIAAFRADEAIDLAYARGNKPFNNIHVKLLVVDVFYALRAPQIFQIPLFLTTALS